jgi:calcium-translocating P-type ATPase
MSVAIAEEPRVISALPGRVRVHLPRWSGAAAHAVEAGLCQIPGVRTVRANAHTCNTLLVFDPAVTNLSAVLRAVSAFDTERCAAEPTNARLPASPPHVVRDRDSTRRVVRARIAVRGMDRDPEIARRVVERLRAKPGVVRVVASQLTGRVLVECVEHEEDIRDLIAEVTDIGLPDLPGESEPAHPLDPGPLIQSIARLSGAALGLGLVAASRLLGTAPDPGVGAAAARTASIISVLQGIPVFRNGLRRLLGRDIAEVTVATPMIVSLTTSHNPLGLTLTAAESLRTLTEVVPRRAAWHRYEERLSGVASAEPGAIVRLEPGERTPLAAEVIAGTGTATRADGMPHPVVPGEQVTAGARMYGGPFVLRLLGGEPFLPLPRPAPPATTLFDRYVNVTGGLSLGYAALSAVFTRSFDRTLEAMMLVNPRTALIGADAAETSAAARVLRAGVIIVGTRAGRVLVRPDYLLLDSPRLLADGYELTGIVSLSPAHENAELLARAAGIAQAAGSPWGGAFRTANAVSATEGSFSSGAASAVSAGVRYVLRPLTSADTMSAATRLRHRGHYLLVLENERDEEQLGLFALRPRLEAGISELVRVCRHTGVKLELLSAGDPTAAQTVAHRSGLHLLREEDSVEAIRSRQAGGGLVAFASDGADAARAFAACDMAIGVTDGRAHFPARADLLAPDVISVAAIIDATGRRQQVVNAAILLSLASNVAGAVWAGRGAPGLERASRILYVTALSSIAFGWLRLRGGERPHSTLARLTDPKPERWGGRDVASVLQSLGTTGHGLTSEQAAQRQHRAAQGVSRRGLCDAIVEQLRSPLTGMLIGGALLSLVLGAAADVAIIGATVAANVFVGVWQERKASAVADALQRMGASSTQVLRDGVPVSLPSTATVPGDVLLLAPGDRVPADARVVEAQGLEVDEAALTGESLPVPKSAESGPAASRIVLEGSDITAGTGRAAVVAVGRDTRLGATAEALSVEESEESPLGKRLGQVLKLVLPLAAASGMIVTGTGLLRGQALLPQLALGATIALAAVPEGLPLLAGVTEAAVARRLAGRDALVRRLSAVEALGRVDVACTDKTGTLTEGRLAVRLVASADADNPDADCPVPGLLSDAARRVLLTAALASPHPDSEAAASHPTDAAVMLAARDAGMGGVLLTPRAAEAPFDPARSLHASIVEGRLCAKGAPETLIPRCSSMWRDHVQQPLDDASRERLRERAEVLAGRGLRVLLVADSPTDASVQDPRDLTALGFVGIADPLKPAVPAAVRRCREAGVRVVMITGDHPATARAIAREAGLLDDDRQGDGELLTGPDIAELQNGELEERLERATVIARATPLDKLRIIETLQRSGHTVAMTGDGVNDAPALRLADVGVAMGRGGTEVARQTADVVLMNDDFATLVDTFVEGRSFWRNVRRAMSLLLGGNLGELGLVVGASVLGLASPLTVSQVLAVNLITDVLPSLSVALQRPEHHNLAALSREGTQALDASLRDDVLHRGALTAGPSLAAYALALGSGTLPQARAVAFGGIVATQLAQTLDAGRAEGTLTRGVLVAVGGSTGVLVGALTIPPLRDLLALAMPGPVGWSLIGGAALTALLFSRGVTVFRSQRSSAEGSPGRVRSSAGPALHLPAPSA